MDAFVPVWIVVLIAVITALSPIAVSLINNLFSRSLTQAESERQLAEAQSMAFGDIRSYLQELIRRNRDLEREVDKLQRMNDEMRHEIAALKVRLEAFENWLAQLPRELQEKLPPIPRVAA